MLKTIERPETKSAPSPPPRWRNWWRAKQMVSLYCLDCGRPETLKPSELLCTCHCQRGYPSQEVAEIAAGRVFDNPDWMGDFEYLGAHREGERP